MTFLISFTEHFYCLSPCGGTQLTNNDHCYSSKSAFIIPTPSSYAIGRMFCKPLFVVFTYTSLLEDKDIPEAEHVEQKLDCEGVWEASGLQLLLPLLRLPQPEWPGLQLPTGCEPSGGAGGDAGPHGDVDQVLLPRTVPLDEPGSQVHLPLNLQRPRYQPGPLQLSRDEAANAYVSVIIAILVIDMGICMHR